MRTKAPMRKPPSSVRSTSCSGRAVMSTRTSGRSTVSRIKSTRVVPPAMYRPPRPPAWRASVVSDALVMVKGCIATSVPARGLLDRANDLDVTATAAEVPAHPLPDLLGRCGVAFLDTADTGHDLARGAEAALIGVLVYERLLQRMQLVAVSQSLDGGDLHTVQSDGQGQT